MNTDYNAIYCHWLRQRLSNVLKTAEQQHRSAEFLSDKQGRRPLDVEKLAVTEQILS